MSFPLKSEDDDIILDVIIIPITTINNNLKAEVTNVLNVNKEALTEKYLGMPTYVGS